MIRQPASFQAEVTQRFRFLVDEYGLDGPAYHERLPPTVTYADANLSISIFFHAAGRDGAGTTVSVSISFRAQHEPARAELPSLVEAATFAPQHKVACKAHSADAMRSTLDNNATWLRRLMPVLRGPDALETVKNAAHPPIDKAGNPKRRPPNVKWKYN